MPITAVTAEPVAGTVHPDSAREPLCYEADRLWVPEKPSTWVDVKPAISRFSMRLSRAVQAGECIPN
jgi:hypothetical protein